MLIEVCSLPPPAPRVPQLIHLEILSCMRRQWVSASLLLSFDFQCSVLGNNLKDLVDQYQQYEDASCGLLSGLQACEAKASKHLREPIALDPKNLQRQLEETKVKEEGGKRSDPSAVLSKEFCSPRARG